MIHENTFTPISDRNILLTSNPLEPCKIRRMEQNRYLTIQHNLDDWDPKQTTYEITAFQFNRSDEEAYQKPEITRCEK